MTVQTEGGRVVVMLIILTSLAVLPSLVTDVLATNRKRNGEYIYLWWRVVYILSLFITEGGGHVSSGSMPFILIVGAFRLEQVNEILDGFLNRVSKLYACGTFQCINCFGGTIGKCRTAFKRGLSWYQSASGWPQALGKEFHVGASYTIPTWFSAGKKILTRSHTLAVD